MKAPWYGTVAPQATLRRVDLQKQMQPKTFQTTLSTASVKCDILPAVIAISLETAPKRSCPRLHHAIISTAPLSKS
jgi:hypothetical protein